VLDVVQRQVRVVIPLDLACGLALPANVEQPSVIADEVPTVGRVAQRVGVGGLAGEESLAQSA
jgi:hypothetical protein